MLVAMVNGHAYLSEPPSRSSAWLVDPDFVDCCKNYNYNQMFCGGISKQWIENGGRCGICGKIKTYNFKELDLELNAFIFLTGDAWDDEPKSYEKGCDKYLGKIVRTYKKNQELPVTVQVRRDTRVCIVAFSKNNYLISLFF